mmetsp:Transcript_14170/g.26657  ORF Transcript_14170/g.26657 Transcript_14170/m.26657 type:complete len:359 (-) Transcript_14170:2658-3734(-)
MDSTEAPQIIEHTSVSLTFTPFETRWVPCSARFVLLGQTPGAKGIARVYQLDKNQENKVKLLGEVIQGPGYKCATFGASSLTDRSIAVGDFGGNLEILDLETLQASYKVKAHDAIINSIDGAGGGPSAYGQPEIVTGSRDGCVKVWDPRTPNAVLALEPAEEVKPDCWAVAFGNCYNDSERCLAAGYDNGDLKLFDMRTNCLQWDHNLANAVCGLQFDRRDTMMNKLAVATLEGKFTMFDLRTFNATSGGYSGVTTKAHDATVWGVRHTQQNRDLLAVQGGNGSLNIYKYNYPTQRSVQDENGQAKGVPGTLTLLNQRDLSTQPISSFDWNAEKFGLSVMCCLDQTLKVAIVTKLNLY